MSEKFKVQSIGTTRINLPKKTKIFEDDVFITFELSNEIILQAANEIKEAVAEGCVNRSKAFEQQE